MPPVMLNSRRSLISRPPFSRVTAPAPLIDATLNENACGPPMCGSPSRLNRMRSIAPVSVAVPTVERTSPPIRSWPTTIAVVSPSRTSTSGRLRVGISPCRNALYVSLIIRWDSAAIVENTSELLPEPETPVKTVSRRLGSSTLTSRRLFSRAPWTRIRSWPSAAAWAGASVLVAVLVAVLIGGSVPAGGCVTSPRRSGSCFPRGRGRRRRGCPTAARWAPGRPRRRRTAGARRCRRGSWWRG